MEELLAKLQELLKEESKEEAKAIFEQIRSVIVALDEKIKVEERGKKEAIETRDKAKDKLRTYDRAIGRKDEESIEEALERINKSHDEKESGKLIVKDREIESLKAEVASSIEKGKQEIAKKDKEILAAILERDVAALAPKYKIKENGIQYVINTVKDLATFEDGKIVFKDRDGITSRTDGRDKSVDDVVKNMREKEVEAKESMFFDIKVQPSGPTGTESGDSVDNSGDYFCG